MFPIGANYLEKKYKISCYSKKKFHGFYKILLQGEKINNEIEEHRVNVFRVHFLQIIQC